MADLRELPSDVVFSAQALHALEQGGKVAWSHHSRAISRRSGLGQRPGYLWLVVSVEKDGLGPFKRSGIRCNRQSVTGNTKRYIPLRRAKSRAVSYSSCMT